MKKTEKLMSAGILQPVLHSSWQVQWWSEFSGVGKRNSDESLKTPHSQYNLQVSLMASSHPRAWGCHSNVHGGQPCSSRTRAACFPFWWWLDPLTHRLPCPLLLTSAAIVTVCFQQGKGEEKPLWAFGSVQERLTAGVRVWTREPAVSMCCQQSWPDSCCTSCALHVLMAQRRWKGHFENEGFQLPRYPLTLESLWLPGQSITALAPT